MRIIQKGLESLESFKSKEIVFYTLILNEKENQKIQESPEILEDFLEDKICSLLNLPRTCEYFLRFSCASNAYHCLLINKDSLKSYVRDAETFLSHPCLLCAQFLQEGKESQAFLVLDSYSQWTLVHYEKGAITLFQPLQNLESAQEKIQALRQKSADFLLTFWLINKPNQEIQTLQSQFNAQILSYDINQIEPLQALNFNPLEKTPPLSQQKIGKALKFGALGALVGFGIWLVLLAFYLLESREIADLQAQIEEQNIKINRQNQSNTESQKQMLSLQEKHDSLQMLYNQNAQFLKSAMPPNATHLAPLFSTINPILERQNVKIAYFALEKDSLCLLLKGKNTLQVLEELEKTPLKEVQSLEKYQDFYWIQFALRIPQ